MSHHRLILTALLCLVAIPAHGEPPADLRTRIDGLLRNELTRGWYPRSIDRHRGGFHQTFARDWSPLPDRDTFLVYQARMTWTAAAFARYSPEHRDEFIGYARHGIAFLDTVMRDREQGGFHWMLDPAGRLDPRLGDEKHAYGIAFVIYAAATAREVTGDDLALKVARDAFDWFDPRATTRSTAATSRPSAATARRSRRGTPPLRSPDERIAWASTTDTRQ